MSANGAYGSTVWRHVPTHAHAPIATKVDNTSPRDGKNDRAVAYGAGAAGTHSLGSTPYSGSGAGRHASTTRSQTWRILRCSEPFRRLASRPHPDVRSTGADRRRRGAVTPPSPSHGALADAMPPTAMVG